MSDLPGSQDVGFFNQSGRKTTTFDQSFSSQQLGLLSSSLQQQDFPEELAATILGESLDTEFAGGRGSGSFSFRGDGLQGFETVVRDMEMDDSELLDSIVPVGIAKNMVEQQRKRDASNPIPFDEQDSDTQVYLGNVEYLDSVERRSKPMPSVYAQKIDIRSDGIEPEKEFLEYIEHSLDFIEYVSEEEQEEGDRDDGEDDEHDEEDVVVDDGEIKDAEEQTNQDELELDDNIQDIDANVELEAVRMSNNNDVNQEMLDVEHTIVSDNKTDNNSSDLVMQSTVITDIEETKKTVKSVLSYDLSAYPAMTNSISAAPTSSAPHSISVMTLSVPRAVPHASTDVLSMLSTLNHTFHAVGPFDYVIPQISRDNVPELDALLLHASICFSVMRSMHFPDCMLLLPDRNTESTRNLQGNSITIPINTPHHNTVSLNVHPQRYSVENELKDTIANIVTLKQGKMSQFANCKILLVVFNDSAPLVVHSLLALSSNRVHLRTPIQHALELNKQYPPQFSTDTPVGVPFYLQITVLCAHLQQYLPLPATPVDLAFTPKSSDYVALVPLLYSLLKHKQLNPQMCPAWFHPVRDSGLFFQAVLTVYFGSLHAFVSIPHLFPNPTALLQFEKQYNQDSQTVDDTAATLPEGFSTGITSLPFITAFTCIETILLVDPALSLFRVQKNVVEYVQGLDTHSIHATQDTPTTLSTHSPNTLDIFDCKHCTGHEGCLSCSPHHPVALTKWLIDHYASDKFSQFIPQQCDDLNPSSSQQTYIQNYNVAVSPSIPDLLNCIARFSSQMCDFSQDSASAVAPTQFKEYTEQILDTPLNVLPTLTGGITSWLGRTFQTDSISKVIYPQQISVDAVYRTADEQNVTNTIVNQPKTPSSAAPPPAPEHDIQLYTCAAKNTRLTFLPMQLEKSRTGKGFTAQSRDQLRAVLTHFEQDMSMQTAEPGRLLLLSNANAATQTYAYVSKTRQWAVTARVFDEGLVSFPELVTNIIHTCPQHNIIFQCKMQDLFSLLDAYVAPSLLAGCMLQLEQTKYLTMLATIEQHQVEHYTSQSYSEHAPQNTVYKQYTRVPVNKSIPYPVKLHKKIIQSKPAQQFISLAPCLAYFKEPLSYTRQNAFQQQVDALGTAQVYKDPNYIKKMSAMYTALANQVPSMDLLNRAITTGNAPSANGVHAYISHILSDQELTAEQVGIMSSKIPTYLLHRSLAEYSNGGERNCNSAVGLQRRFTHQRGSLSSMSKAPNMSILDSVVIKITEDVSANNAHSKAYSKYTQQKKLVEEYYGMQQAQEETPGSSDKRQLFSEEVVGGGAGGLAEVEPRYVSGNNLTVELGGQESSSRAQLRTPQTPRTPRTPASGASTPRNSASSARLDWNTSSRQTEIPVLSQQGSFSVSMNSSFTMVQQPQAVPLLSVLQHSPRSSTSINSPANNSEPKRTLRPQQSLRDNQSSRSPSDLVLPQIYPKKQQPL